MVGSTKKFVSNDITWPDERIFAKSIWRYRIQFKKQLLINDWKNGARVPPNIMLNTGRKVVDKKIFFALGT